MPCALTPAGRQAAAPEPLAAPQLPWPGWMSQLDMCPKLEAAPVTRWGPHTPSKAFSPSQRGICATRVPTLRK